MPEQSDGPAPFPYTRVYTGEDGQTHIEQHEVPLGDGARSNLSELWPATGIIFRRTPPDLFADWHPAPRRQFIITVEGEGEIEVSDGSILPLGPGSVVLVEDVDGIGHITRGKGTKDRLSLFIPLPEE